MSASLILGKGKGFSQGFDRYEEDPPPQKPARDVNTGVLPWLEARDQETPFFLYVHYYDAHCPYDPPFPNDRLFTDTPGLIQTAGKCNKSYFNKLDLSTEVAEYLLSLDEWEVRVPFMLHCPNGPMGEIATPVSILGFFKTALSMLGIEEPPGIVGQDLSPLVRGETIQSEPIFCELAVEKNNTRQACVIHDGWKLLFRPAVGGSPTEGEYELTSLRGLVAGGAPDPSLMSSKEREKVIGDLKSLLDPWYKEWAIKIIRGEVEGLDEETRERLRWLG